jgi:hypothetical protein
VKDVLAGKYDKKETGPQILTPARSTGPQKKSNSIL